MIENFRKRGEAGFTLIELLVVIAIIGILAAIAIPQFAAYRKRGFDSQVRSDLRNMATAQEAYFVTKNEYVECTDCPSKTPEGWNSSEKVDVKAEKVGTNQFKLTGTHENCGTDSWLYESEEGLITYTGGDEKCGG